MNFINKLFNKNNKDCPRCLGKGNVDWEDIKRLNKELKWRPGSCAYCNGKGKINTTFENKVSLDNTYLTTDLTETEKMKIINGDEQVILRGIHFEEKADAFINKVKFLNINTSLTAEKITEFYLIPEKETSIDHKEELLDYIKRIVI